jgi:putative transposase
MQDDELKKDIIRAREKRGRKLYGAKKMWHELNRDEIEVARCTVERLMGEMGIAGARARRKRPRTTVPGPAGQERPSDLLGRDFTARRRTAAGSPILPMSRQLPVLSALSLFQPG